MGCRLLALRVVVDDHQTELEPFDRVHFMVK
jgi:hypothetical protein